MCPTLSVAEYNPLYGQIYRLGDDLAVVLDLDPDGIQVDDGIDIIKGAVLPETDFLGDGLMKP